MRNSEARLVSDMDYAKTASFVNLCKALKNSHFTRSRKMPLHQLILSVLSRTGKTLHMEIRSFTKLLNLKDSISKVGYLKQRKKLSPHAFLELSRNHARNFYRDHPSLKKLKGFLILAVDGSAINIPTTKETLSTYGNASKGNRKPQAQIGLSSLFDTLNKMMIDCSINRTNFCEREQAHLHLERMGEVIGKHPSILLYDRGYPSGELLIDHLERQQ